MTALFVAPSTLHDRGVFAARAFSPGEIIERCPVIVVPADERLLVDKTRLYDYYFTWDEDSAAIALGYGSLYNHSPRHNAFYQKDFAESVVDILAVRAIRPNEEITVDYTNGGTNELWFRPSV